jgi:murein DD-endopeptidase MepM/ murein hydrolase activator NlpD
LHAAKQRVSFMIASMSLFAFVVGNMVGQHGWYAFWKNVMGKEEETIAFVGTVPPIAQIPDYTEWAKYGGNKQNGTFNLVPSQVLRDLPPYDAADLARPDGNPLAKQAYSTQWAGGYSTVQGSHAGVDIDAPRGTPVVAIANGFVDKVAMLSTGFGHHIMVRHPGVPDPDRPGSATTLYSTYAHLDSVLVQEGEVVHKGQVIGTVGNTGLVFGATGYHLYFQVEKADAPFHPYWPFTTADASSNGLSFYAAVNSTLFQSNVYKYTVSPIAYTNRYRDASSLTVALRPAATPSSQSSSAESVKQTAATRLQARLAKAGLDRPVVVAVNTASSSSSSSVAPVEPDIVTTVTQTAEVEKPVLPIISGSNTDVDHLEIRTSGKIARGWQKVTIEALDSDGNLVGAPSFSGKLYVVPEFGEAEIRPTELSPLDFMNGKATVNVLARTNKTLFIATRGEFQAVSGAMVYER